MINAIKLNERITLQQKTYVKDAFKTNQEVWTDFASVWSEVTYNNGNKSYDSDLDILLNTYTVNFIIRWIDDLTYNFRILWEGNIYDILSIEKLKRKEGYKIITQRKENN